MEHLSDTPTRVGSMIKFHFTRKYWNIGKDYKLANYKRSSLFSSAVIEKEKKDFNIATCFALTEIVEHVIT